MNVLLTKKMNVDSRCLWTWIHLRWPSSSVRGGAGNVADLQVLLRPFFYFDSFLVREV